MSVLAERFESWQSAGLVHPLTCGNDDCQERAARGESILELVHDEGDTIVLGCAVCGYSQTVHAKDSLGQLVLSFDPKAFRAVRAAWDAFGAGDA